MALKKPTKPQKATTGTTSTASTKKNTRNYAQSLKSLIYDERVRYAFAIVLLLATLYITLASISFFATGKADYSILEGTIDQLNTERLEISNWTGPLGASIANTLIVKWFGFASFILLIALGRYTFHLMRVKSLSLTRLFFHTTFWTVWTSIAIAFFFQHFYSDSFYCWGGIHGLKINTWLTSYIRIPGVLLLLTAILLVFLIATNKNTIPFLRALGRKFKALLTPKPKAEKAANEQDEEEAAVAVGTEIIPEDWVVEDELKEEEDEADDHSPIVVEYAMDDEPIITPQPTSTTDYEIETNEVEVAETTEKTGNDLQVEFETPVDTEGCDGSENTPELERYDPTLDLSHYEFPTFDLLKTYPNENMPIVDDDEQKANINRIKTTLLNYGIEIVSIKATVGPTITLYEIVPKAGVRIAKIRNLESDIMLSLAATGIRIIAPIPGKGTIGIEVPNENPQIVSMHSVIVSKKFQEASKFELPVALGRTITNEVFMFDLAKTPHLLVAGATGQGKSVGLNAIITSLLYKKHPAQLKFVLIDPKMVEFNIYASLEKHYMAMMPGEDDVIITDSTKVIQTLNSLVVEMEDRYKLLMEARCRNIVEYNEKFVSRRLNPEKGHRFMPYIVIVIDEFGDLIMVAGKEIEMPISRITQKARAVGMHMILATQRPSVNIITGVIKANVPGRVAFRVSSMIDSRTILDAPGANQLVGKGDLLYSGGSDLVRVQCAFVDTPEVEEVVNHISRQQSYSTAYALPEYIAGEGEAGGTPGAVDMSKRDPLFTEVARFVVAQQQGSTSAIQRRFQIGYNKAGRITDQLEAAGIVSANNGSKGRQVLVQDDFTLTQILESLQ